MQGDEPLTDPTRIVVSAYLLAAVCVVVPLALIGALFAGVVLLRRSRRAEGLGVIAVAIACTVLGILLIR